MTKNFIQVFLDAVDKMEADAHANGTNLTAICREVGAGRATPDVWRKKPPKTIRLLAEMQEVAKGNRK